ncbi:MAG: type I-E CRISPR-associated protein Cas7/Cse4/CasC [Nostocoides sp.]
MSTYIDLHILQDLPPSNINRDDNGTPKHAVYGGVQRLRVSSQAWKRATRKHFEENGAQADLGVRTRRLQALLSELVAARGIEPSRAATLAAAGLAQLKIKPGKKGAESSYLFFASRQHLELVAAKLAEAGDPGEVQVAKLLGSMHSLDVALFGRMVADMAALNVDAAAQVAHAISTHAAQTQFDYFVAVDDEQDQDEPGAGMIGTVEFNSATIYRFATVGLEQLVDNMADREKAIEGVGRFIRSFAESMPTGHQSSFAARTRPHLILVVIRDDQPVNLVGAFEEPIRAVNGSGYVQPSLRALAETYRDETARWGDTPRLVVASYSAHGTVADSVADVFGPSLTRDELVAGVTGALAQGGVDG